MPAEPDPSQSQEELSQESERLSEEGRIVAAVAHELKNPIQTLGNLLYLATREASTPAVRDYLALAQQELSILRTIVATTLSSVRGHASEARISLAEILNGSLRGFSEKISYKQITIEKRIESSEVLRTSPVEVRMIIDNIVSNALEAVPIGGRVLIHISRAREWRDERRSGYRIVVADNGPGIQPDHRTKIFEPFFTTKTEKGTGIGLWVVQRTVRKYDGSIRLRTSVRPGKRGTVFSIFLPIADEATPSAIQLNAKSETASQSST